MNIAVGADERTHTVEWVLRYLQEQGNEVVWYGPQVGETDPWPDVARKVALDVESGNSEQGILFCWTGTGVSIAANKVSGVRAALCVDAETARGAKLWNNANVLCLSLRLTTEAVAGEILKTWFETSYQPNPQDDLCLSILAGLDQNH